MFELLHELITVATDVRAVITPERAAELHKIVNDLEGKAPAEMPADTPEPEPEPFPQP